MSGGSPPHPAARQKPAPGPPSPLPPAAVLPSGADRPLPFRLLPTRPTDWDPASAAVTLNVRLDGCIAPSEASEEGARIAYAHAVVFDDFIDDACRRELLHFLLHGEAAAGREGSPVPNGQEADLQRAQQEQQQGQQPEQEQGHPQALPPGRWERRTTDMAGAAPTWGVKQHVLRELAAGRLPAMQEVHARLCRLYPECDIAHLPSDAIQLPAQAPGAPPPDQQQPQQQQAQGQQQQQAPAAPPLDQQAQHGQQQGQYQHSEQHAAEASDGRGQPPAKRSRSDGTSGRADCCAERADQGCVGGTSEGGGQTANGGEAAQEVDCACFVANAAVQGDSFRYHVDADPTSFPDGSPWHAAFGDYFNGEPGKPLLASLLLYLNEEWQREWGGDTLLLDGQTDTGVFVAPRPCRVVLFDQDILHRVSAPLPAAGGRPRFSLVWKLAFLPKRPGQALCLARPEWGPPVSFGSAARVDAVRRQLAAERRQQRRQGQQACG